jgi:dTDP-4-amino-4,6-dideoxygalactose transaminase
MADYLFNNQIAPVSPYKDIAEVAATHYGYEGDCPVAEEVAKRVLVIPNNYSLKRREVQRIAQCVNEGWEQITRFGRKKVHYFTRQGFYL